MNLRSLGYMLGLGISCCQAQEVGKEVIMHQNKVSYQAAVTQPPLKIGFVLSAYKVTSGQPWGGVEVGDGVDIVVQAGRHNSEEVVDWVKKNQVVAFSVENAAGTTRGLPKELNFAIKGSLQFYDGLYGQRLVCDDVVIAQGHYFFMNNWWLFSNYDNGGRQGVDCRGSCTRIHCSNAQIPGSSYLVRISTSTGGGADFSYFVSVLDQPTVKKID